MGMELEFAKNKKFKNPAKIIICVVLCVLFILQSFSFASASDKSDKSFTPKFDEKYKNYYAMINLEDELAELIGGTAPVLDELLDLYVELNYYDLTREQAITSMLRKLLMDYPELLPILGDSLLTSIDNYGGYYPAAAQGSSSSSSATTSAYRGYGVVLGGNKIIDGNEYDVIIKRVFAESPADIAGIKPGDAIIKIENINAEYFGANAVSHLLATYSGKISITVRRNGKDMTFNLSRGTVYMQSVSFTLDNASKTAAIKIDNFTDEYMIDDICELFDYLGENKFKNIILDLRGNTGGNLFNMLETLNCFVPDKGVCLYSQVNKNGEAESAESSGDGIAFEKICVLTNGRTASMSEGLALSLRELAGAVIVGENTYGKGLGQWSVDLSNGDTATITSFEMLSAKGTKYHKKGVEPDIKISPEYISVERKPFGQLNFVNCINIKKGADNNAILALNQRLASIGYIFPEDVTSECTDKTITAVEIFQKYNNLPVGISKIDYMFLNYLNYSVGYYSPGRYQERDIQLECAEIYIKNGRQAAADYAGEFSE